MVLVRKSSWKDEQNENDICFKYSMFSSKTICKHIFLELIINGYRVYTASSSA